MDFHGHITLNNNEMQRMVLQVETDFPTTPVAGRIAFKGSKVWICVEIEPGVLAWVPLTPISSTYVHDQESASASWTVTHNLNTTTPIVQVFDPTDMSQVIPETVEPSSVNALTLTFGTAVAGRAVVVFGNQNIFFSAE